MSNEHVDDPSEEWEKHEDQYDQHEQFLWRHDEVRVAAKDLLLNVEALPAHLPYRAKVVQMVNEILTLVPVLDSEAEARDERRRHQLAENLRRSRAQRE